MPTTVHWAHQDNPGGLIFWWAVGGKDSGALQVIEHRRAPVCRNAGAKQKNLPRRRRITEDDWFKDGNDEEGKELESCGFKFLEEKTYTYPISKKAHSYISYRNCETLLYL